MLYWDHVATIVPRDYIDDPGRHDPYTLELVREGVLLQVFPDAAGHNLARNFDVFLNGLSPDEIDRRREGFVRGQFSNVYTDKWLTYRAGLQEIRRVGLASPERYDSNSDIVQVETRTAAEFMAALALSLCETAGELWHRTNRPRFENWVPATDVPEALQALLSGLTPASSLDNERTDFTHRRVAAENRALSIRTSVLKRLLPVPDEPMPAEQIIQFRRRHGHLLPAFRRYLEGVVDEVLVLDPDLRARRLDRLEAELEDRIVEAEAYLREEGVRRLGRSSLLKVFKFLPLLKDTVEASQDFALSLSNTPEFEAKPLAYLAFANLTFVRSETYEVDPFTGMPLGAAISADKWGLPS